jgi:hypothetical protein
MQFFVFLTKLCQSESVNLTANLKSPFFKAGRKENEAEYIIHQTFLCSKKEKQL